MISTFCIPFKKYIQIKYQIFCSTKLTVFSLLTGIYLTLLTYQITYSPRIAKYLALLIYQIFFSLLTVKCHVSNHQMPYSPSLTKNLFSLSRYLSCSPDMPNTLIFPNRQLSYFSLTVIQPALLICQISYSPLTINCLTFPQPSHILLSWYVKYCTLS